MHKLLSGRHILVVEDEIMILMIIEDMLNNLGCASVTVAATVDQAIAHVDAKVFDAALLDVNLNGINSYPVADALAARGVPFVFSTGYSVNGLREDYRDRPVLTKPYPYRDFVTSLTGLFAS